MQAAAASSPASSLSPPATRALAAACGSTRCPPPRAMALFGEQLRLDNDALNAQELRLGRGAAAQDEDDVLAAALPLSLPSASPAPSLSMASEGDAFEGLYCMSEDVDMDMDIDVDVFRPSAMMDRKLEEEYGSTSAVAALYDGGHGSGCVDIEHMLLTDSDDAVMAQLAQLERSLSGSASADGNPSAVASAIAIAMAGKSTTSIDDGLDTPTRCHAPVRVLRRGFRSVAPSLLASALPPKYFDSVRASPHKRRAHCRTFGERTHRFAFQFAPPPLAPAVAPPAANASAAKPHGEASRRSLFQEAVHDIARHRVRTSPSTSSLELNKENRPPLQQQYPGEVDSDVDADEDNDAGDGDRIMADATELEGDLEDDKDQAAVLDNANEEPKTPAPEQRKNERQQQQPHVFHTPLRRSASTPTACTASTGSNSNNISPSAVRAFQTPAQTRQSSATGMRISPAVSFDKAAVVHAKDTPGRVDKFEWRIGAASAGHRLVHTEGASRSSSNGEGRDSSSSRDKLPPRYFSDASTSPHKRHVVHSTTFGSFARSFSFTNAP